MGKTTVYDIARELQLSPSTVSRVLNNSSLISDEKKQLILETANRMNYERRVIRKQSKRAILNIRLFLPQSKYSYMRFFYDTTELTEGLRRGFKNTIVNIIFNTVSEGLSIFSNKKIGHTDGCVFAFCVPNKEIEEKLNEMDIPFILLNRESADYNYVLIDNQSGMSQLVKELKEKHKTKTKIAYVGFEPLKELSKIRQECIISASKHYDVEFNLNDSYILQSIYKIDEVVEKIIKKKNTSIMCFNDVIAIAMYNALLRKGLNVPQDISLTGFDYSPLLFLIDKQIDTVDFSAHSLGEEAGKWLKKYIIDKDTRMCQTSLRGKYVKGDTI